MERIIKIPVEFEIAPTHNGNPIGSSGFSSGDLEDDIEIGLEGHSYQIEQSENKYALNLDPGNGIFAFGGFDPTGNNAGGFAAYVSTDSSGVQSSLIAAFNAGAKIATILLDVSASAALASYTADKHTFNGKIINPDIVAKNFADDVAAASGGVSIGEDYHTDGVKKVRIS